MKTTLFFITALLIPVLVIAQDNPDQEVMSKKEKKELEKEHRQAVRATEELQLRQAVDSMISQRRFVLEADYVSGKTGSRVPVSSTLNFIIVDSAEVVLQLGSLSGVGYNGVGGITVEGNVTKYEMSKKEGKKGVSYSITIFIMSNLGVYDIQFWISSSGVADASVRGNTSGVLNYSGNLVPIYKSRIYKARAI
jgi:hypothetical protein